MVIRCGHCWLYHETIEEVRACPGRPVVTRFARPSTFGRTSRPWRQRRAVPSHFKPEEPAVAYLISHSRL